MVERGRFITLEGGEGAGKSTQARNLAQRLRALGREVLLTREPGGSPWAERLRNALLTSKGRALCAEDQAILFAAARADHVDTLIAPALDAGRWVVCDRFTDSTEAYQGAEGASHALTELLKTVAIGALRPDLTLVLDVPPKTGLTRAADRNALDPFEADSLAVHEARRDRFLMIAARDPHRCAVIDGTVSRDEIAAVIWHLVRERLLAREIPA